MRWRESWGNIQEQQGNTEQHCFQGFHINPSACTNSFFIYFFKQLKGEFSEKYEDDDVAVHML